MVQRLGSGICALAVSLFVTAGAFGEKSEIGERASAVWRAGPGDWSVASNWRGGIIPGIGLQTPDVYIDAQLQLGMDMTSLGYNSAGDSISSQVDLSLRVNIGNLYLGATDQLNIKSGAMMMLYAPVDPNIFVFNLGRIVIEQSSASTGITVDGGRSLTLAGDGRVTLNDALDAYITGALGTEELIVAGGTIDGAGRLGNGALTIRNYGTIESNLQFQRLTVEPSAGGISNFGALRASNFSRLLVRNAQLASYDGTIEAMQSSNFDLDNTTIRGGSIITDADSAVRVLNGPAALYDMQILGNVEVGESQLTLGGIIENDGAIVCVGDSDSRGGALPINPSQIIIPSTGGTTLSGSGRLDLIVGSVWSGQTGLHAQFTNGADHTIHGRGNVGNDTLCITNNGTIIADGATPLIVDPCDASPFVNNGTLKASGDGVMYLVDGTFNNSGTIEVAEGGQVVMLPGASLNNSLSGSLLGGKWVIRASSDVAELILLTSSDFSNNMADVTLDGPLSRFDRLNMMQFNLGTFRLLNGRVFNATGDFTNTGVLHLDSQSRLTTNGKLTLNGDSHVTIELSNDSNGTLHAGNRAVLGGVLEIVLAPGASWTPDRNLQIITSNQITGQFTEVIAPGAFELKIVNGAFVVTPHASCTGDLNSDGVVDVIDLLAMLEEWGDCPAGKACAGDLNEDGIVDIFDLLALLGAWGGCP